ncbi:MAG: GAF domain-containing sensor histidine kinase [Bacteriovorax sp.]
MIDHFIQTSSIITRLRVFMIAIVSFIIFCIFVIYLSGIQTLKGLQFVNSANNQLNLISQTIESIDTTEHHIEEISSRKDLVELKNLIIENHHSSKGLIAQMLNLAQKNSDIISLLHKADQALVRMEIDNIKIFDKLISNQRPYKYKSAQREKLNAELLVTRKYLIDAKDILLKIQINIKTENDKVFAALYENRFKPLAITIGLSLLFLAFVVIFGLSLSRRIGESISNLLRATDNVAQGDLDYEVKILKQDEIGRLADAFNKMIASLRNGQNQLGQAIDRTVRLQSITALFSEALTPDQVFDIIFKHAFESLKANAASIALVSEDKNWLELKCIEGYNHETFIKRKRFPLSADFPASKVVRIGQPLFVNSSEISNFRKGLNELDINPLTQAFACLPLIIESRPLGALSFAFIGAKQFSDSEKDFMLALTRQCAQAIHRSLLYDDAKKAIEIRDEFLSIASHELRTPLTPLKLQIQGMARQVKKGEGAISMERIKNMVETSDRQISRLSFLIDDLLDVSRISSGKLVLKKSSFSLKEMINDVVNQYAHQLGDNLSSVEIEVIEDTVGHWDKVRIEQVLINLLINAAKYAPKKPIHIKLYRQNQFAKIAVRDQGPGITKEDCERIFNRFERVASKENVGGLGLGLYISKQIVDAHKGRIYVESTLGVGSTFYVELPEERTI